MQPTTQGRFTQEVVSSMSRPIVYYLMELCTTLTALKAATNGVSSWSKVCNRPDSSVHCTRASTDHGAWLKLASAEGAHSGVFESSYFYDAATASLILAAVNTTACNVQIPRFSVFPDIHDKTFLALNLAQIVFGWW